MQNAETPYNYVEETAVQLLEERNSLMKRLTLITAAARSMATTNEVAAACRPVILDSLVTAAFEFDYYARLMLSGAQGLPVAEAPTEAEDSAEEAEGPDLEEIMEQRAAAAELSTLFGGAVVPPPIAGKRGRSTKAKEHRFDVLPDHPEFIPELMSVLRHTKEGDVEHAMTVEAVGLLLKSRFSTVITGKNDRSTLMNRLTGYCKVSRALIERTLGDRAPPPKPGTDRPAVVDREIGDDRNIIGCADVVLASGAGRGKTVTVYWMTDWARGWAAEKYGVDTTFEALPAESYIPSQDQVDEALPNWKAERLKLPKHPSLGLMALEAFSNASLKLDGGVSHMVRRGIDFGPGTAQVVAKTVRRMQRKGYLAETAGGAFQLTKSGADALAEARRKEAEAIQQ